MVSVRCIRPGLPGGNSMSAKRVPFSGGGVPMMRAPRSSISSPMEQSAGVESVDQMRVEVAPEAPLFALVAGPSMMTLATLLRSWPVTTRRIGGSFGGWLMFSHLVDLLLGLVHMLDRSVRMDQEIVADEDEIGLGEKPRMDRHAHVGGKPHQLLRAPHPPPDPLPHVAGAP